MSGAPVELYPDSDEKFPKEGAAKFNDFDFDPNSQLKCPFASHIRKTRPRIDVKNVDKFDIMRRGLPFGPDHDPTTEPHKTTQDRGLMFVCYQTSLNNGFSFIKNSKLFQIFKFVSCYTCACTDRIFKSGATRITFRRRRKSSPEACFQGKIPSLASLFHLQSRRTMRN